MSYSFVKGRSPILYDNKEKDKKDNDSPVCKGLNSTTFKLSLGFVPQLLHYPLIHAFLLCCWVGSDGYIFGEIINYLVLFSCSHPMLCFSDDTRIFSISNLVGNHVQCQTLNIRVIKNANFFIYLTCPMFHSDTYLPFKN